jgi:4a-hydroxytetrahydrobiopterin dehydratase
MNCDLSKKKCIPCEGGMPPLKGSALTELQQQLEKGWKVVDEHHLEKEYSFKNFREALAFTNAVGAIAEEEGHHPDILLTYGKVKIQLWTHKIDGLAESDFILAAKIDRCFSNHP